MEFSNIIAIIGALAWLPQIIQWISDYLKKPKLQVITAPTCIIGYNSYGPFIYLTASISSEKTDAIVTNVDVLVKHESGEQRLLRWTSVSENQFNVQSLTSPDEARLVRNLNVLAIKAIQETLIERSILFQDILFAGQVNEKFSTLKDNFKYLLTSDSEQKLEPVHPFSKSKEYKETEFFLTDSIFWREGNYSATMSFQVKNLEIDHYETFSFKISRQNLDALKKNTELIKENLYKATINDTQETIKWNDVLVKIN